VAGIREGDANTQFFRIYAAKRSKRNHINCLRSGDRVASDQAEMEHVATDFFVGLLGAAQSRQHDISLAHLGLPAVDVSSLEASFTDNEVWAAIRSMPADKSPGLTAFPGRSINLAGRSPSKTSSTTSVRSPPGATSSSTA
jgi:hypothetical protein